MRGWLVAVPAVAVAVGIAVIAIDGEQEAAPPTAVLADEARWSFYGDPDDGNAVAPGPDGGAWVGTDGGLLYWDGAGLGWQRYRHPADAEVASVAVADDGTVWTATRNQGVGRFDGETWTTFTRDDGLPHDRVPSLRIDADDEVWAATFDGVARFDGDGWTSWTSSDAPSDGRDMAMGDDDSVWVSTTVSVWHFDGETWTEWSTLDDDLPHREVTALATGAQGTVWAATTSGGVGLADHDTASSVVRFDGEDWAIEATNRGLPPHRQKLPHEVVRELAVHDGVLWAADAGGTSRFVGGQWTVYDGEGALRADAFTALTGGDGALWAANDHGVARFEAGRWASYEGLPENHIQSVAVDGGGAVWAGARDDGVVRLDGDQWDRWTTDDGVAHDRVSAIAVDDGTVWTGARGGVSRFDGEEWTSWTVEDGLAHEAATSLALDADGDVWAGSPAGVSRFDGKDWTSWTAEDVLGEERVRAITVAVHEGTVWAGGNSDHGSVARFDGDEWTVETSPEALPGGHVLALATGDDDAVWVGTRDGIAHFNGQRWATAAKEEASLGLDPEHPVASRRVTAVQVDEDGTVWAGGTWGVARFDGSEWTTTAGSVAHVNAMASTGEALWVGTIEGLARFDY